MTGFILGFFACYLIGAALEWRVVQLFRRQHPEIDTVSAIGLALRWPLSIWFLGEEQD